MNTKPSTLRKRVGILIVLLLVGGAGAAAYFMNIPIPGLKDTKPESANAGSKTRLKKVALVKGAEHTIVVPEEVRKSLGMRKNGKDIVAIAQKPTGNRPMTLSGSTMFDPTYIWRLKTRFTPAEIVRIEPMTIYPKQGTTERKLQVGDVVAAGTPLAVLYSPDVASKKNDLIDALVNFKFDKDLYDRAKKNSGLPEVIIEGYRKAVQSDENSISRSLETLKLWYIPQEDIDAVYRAADEIIKSDGKRKPEVKNDPDGLNPWGKVILKSPANGVIIEQNISEKEVINDSTYPLYQIANADNLLVIAHCPEEDVKELIELKNNPLKNKKAELEWTVRTLGSLDGRGVSGPIQEIAQLVDQNTHTIPIKGRIVNKDGIIRAGQYVTVTIDLPPPDDVVEIPVNAIADDGKQAVVFVQPNADTSEYAMRRVVITHRFDNRVFVRSELSDNERKLSAEDQDQGLLPKAPLRLGERVILAGLLELKKELEDLESEKTEEVSEKK